MVLKRWIKTLINEPKHILFPDFKSSPPLQHPLHPSKRISWNRSYMASSLLENSLFSIYVYRFHWMKNKLSLKFYLESYMYIFYLESYMYISSVIIFPSVHSHSKKLNPNPWARPVKKLAGGRISSLYINQ